MKNQNRPNILNKQKPNNDKQTNNNRWTTDFWLRIGT